MRMIVEKTLGSRFGLNVPYHLLLSTCRPPEEAAAREDNLHPGPAGRAGDAVQQDQVSRHLHEGRGCYEDQPP